MSKKLKIGIVNNRSYSLSIYELLMEYFSNVLKNAKSNIVYVSTRKISRYISTMYSIETRYVSAKIMYILKTLAEEGLIIFDRKKAYGSIYKVPIENIPRILNKLLELNEKI